MNELSPLLLWLSWYCVFRFLFSISIIIVQQFMRSCFDLNSNSKNDFSVLFHFYFCLLQILLSSFIVQSLHKNSSLTCYCYLFTIVKLELNFVTFERVSLKQNVEREYNFRMIIIDICSNISNIHSFEHRSAPHLSCAHYFNSNNSRFMLVCMTTISSEFGTIIFYLVRFANSDRRKFKCHKLFLSSLRQRKEKMLNYVE